MSQSFKTNQPEASPHADAKAKPQAASRGANANQHRAITTVEGPVLIIAGPGSGKTFTLVERVVYLIEHKQVSPENMLIVTFTDKAAAELATRISNRLAQIGVKFNLNEMPLGTFHSLCLRWLEEYREFTRLKRNFTLLDEFDQQYFLYSCLADIQRFEKRCAGP